MRLNRLARPLAVVAAAILFAAACGGDEPAPGAQADSETQVVPVTGDAAPAGPAGPATAPRIVFFDRDTAIQASRAGRSMIEQARQLRANAQRELQAEVQKIESDWRDLQRQQAVLAANVRAARQRDIQNRQAALQRKAQLRTEQIQAGFRKALEQFSEVMQPILKDIMTERGAQVMLDRSVVLMAPSMRDFDITPAAVQRVDAKIQTIKVELINPPAPGQRPAAAAAPAAPAAPRPGQ
jgi:outer membrane protein